MSRLNDDESPHRCSICGALFQTSYEFICHQVEDHAESQKVDGDDYQPKRKQAKLSDDILTLLKQTISSNSSSNVPNSNTSSVQKSVF